jgi:hypothetical protein
MAIAPERPIPVKLLFGVDSQQNPLTEPRGEGGSAAICRHREH